MKEAMGGTWLFGIVIAFIVLFASIISVSINWSRAYKVKDEIINQIEMNRGFTKDAFENVNGYVSGIGYSAEGECPDGYLGFNGKDSYDTLNRKVAQYCINRIDLVEYDSDCKVKDGPIGHPKSSYYKIKVFFRFSMPIIGNVFHVDVDGETSTLYNINDDMLFDKDDC